MLVDRTNTDTKWLLNRAGVSNSWHGCLSIAHGGILRLACVPLGWVAGKGPELCCRNKDWAPRRSPTIHPWHTNILQIKVEGVLTLPKNVANP